MGSTWHNSPQAVEWGRNCTGRLLGRWTRVALLMTLLGSANYLQNQQPTARNFGPPDAKPDRMDDTMPMVDATGTVNMKLLRMLDAARQDALVSDSAKLLKLARELETETAGSKSSSYTPEQLHKLGKIEKLARHVKSEMSTSVRDAFLSTGSSGEIGP